MPPEQPKDEVVDFSNFYAKKQPIQPATPSNQIFFENEQANSNDPDVKRRKRLLKIALLIIVILISAEVFLLISKYQNNRVTVPAGYQFVQPADAPPRIAPSK